MSSLNFFAHHASTTNFWLSPLGSTVLGSFHTSERRGGVERRQLELKGIEGGDRKRGVMGGERRRGKSLRIGVHHANAVVWEPVYRGDLEDEERESSIAKKFRVRPSST